MIHTSVWAHMCIHVHTQVLGGIKALLKGYTPKRILDIGARTGLTTAYLATQYPQAQVRACVCVC